MMGGRAQKRQKEKEGAKSIGKKKTSKGEAQPTILSEIERKHQAQDPS